MVDSSVSPPEFVQYRTIYNDDGGDFEHFLVCGNVRYHLLLEFNAAEPDCLENTALDMMYDAMKREDDNALQTATDKCLDILWPFMEGDYTSRSKSATSTNDIVKLQVLTSNGDLHAANHNIDRRFPGTKSVDNIFLDLATYSSSDVERLNELEMHIFKVKMDNSIYCLKTVDRAGSESDFIREVFILRQCSHPNIFRLIGVVETANQKGKLQGMLLDYIENARSLQAVEFISPHDCDKWTNQIRDAIEYLHGKELVWGDAKPSNVLIHTDGNAVLIDFGGGATKDWVDTENYETYRGDLQGLERIISFMKKKSAEEFGKFGDILVTQCVSTMPVQHIFFKVDNLEPCSVVSLSHFLRRHLGDQ